MKGKLYKINGNWFVKYTTYQTIPGTKGVIGSHSKIPESNYIPVHPDHLFYIREGDEFENVDFEKVQEESGVYNDYKITWYAKLINKDKLTVKSKQVKISENKKEFYKYGESLGIKINDLQRLMLLAKASQLEDEAKLITEATNDVIVISRMNEEDIASEIVKNQFLIFNKQDFNFKQD